MVQAGNKRWSIAVLLGIGVLVNYFDRVNLSVAHGALHAEFGISDVVFGYMLSAYSWTYGAMQLPSGALLDRWGVRRTMLISTIIWTVASGLAAVAPTIGLLLAARLLLGIGEAPIFPGNAKAIGQWFPASERGKPTAVFDAAAKLSVGLGTPILGLVLLRYGMRANFALTAVLSLAYTVLFAAIYRNPRPGEGGEVEAPSAPNKVRMADLLKRKKVWGAALGSGAYNYCFYLLLTWLPVYLQQGVRMSEHRAVLLSSIPWLFAAVADLLIGGLLVDALIQRGRNPDRVRRAVLIGGTAMGLFIFAPALTHASGLVVICLSLGLGGLAAAAPVVWMLPALLAPPGGSGRVGGIMNLANQVAAISAPIATGYISARTHSFALAFVVAGVVLFLGVVSYIVLLGRIEQLAPAPIT